METKNTADIPLNDFISYDAERETFRVKAHTIEVPEMEFSFDDMKTTAKGDDLKGVMKKILSQGSVGRLNPTRQYRHGYSNGNGKGRDLKKKIEGFLLRKCGIQKYFDVLDAGSMTLRLKSYKKP